MPRFCASCGTQTEDSATLCAACGKAVGQPSATAAPAQAPAAAGGGLEDNVAGLLAYLTFIPAIIFLVMEPYNKKPFVRFHAWQSIFLNAAAIVIWFAFMFVSIAFSFMGRGGFIMSMLIGVIHLLVLVGLFILWILLVIKAYQGAMFKLPFIGDLAEKQANAK
jgi:uncharacterized membrane protein